MNPRTRLALEVAFAVSVLVVYGFVHTFCRTLARERDAAVADARAADLASAQVINQIQFAVRAVSANAYAAGYRAGQKSISPPSH